ncbi:hypothetical protein FACS189494_03210 [Spirochaetia bacterium]|nr:hypothetical protein FACS189494_03210 [Spirochaetia bacterium]
MKREQKVLVGLLAAILAGALVLAGCENPAGPKGDKGDPGDAASNAQKEQLATYGFTFGNPVHSVIGRAKRYSTSITGIASAAILNNDPISLSSTFFTITYGKKSVRFPVTSGITPTALATGFNDIKGYIDGAGLTLSVVADPKGETTKKSIQISGIDPAKEFTLTVTSGDIAAIFGSATDVPGAAVTPTTISNVSVDDGREDKWTIPVITKDTADNADTSSAPARITFGTKTLEIPATSTAGVISNKFKTDLGTANSVFTGYTVDETGSNSGYITVAADAVGAPTVTQDQLVPGISGYDLGEWGYLVEFKHTVTGRPEVADTTTDHEKVWVSTASSIAAGSVLTVTYGDYSDTTIINATGGTTEYASITNLNLTQTEAYFTGNTLSSGVLTLKATATGAGTFTVTGTAFAEDTAAAARKVGYKSTTRDTGVEDEWDLVVTGGDAIGALIPTVASKISFTGTVAGSIALIPAGTANNTIQTSAESALPAAPSGYTKTGAKYKASAPGAGTFTVPAVSITALY